MKHLLILIAALIFAGCASTPPPINIKADPVPPAILAPPLPNQLQMREIKWTVFNRAKIEKLLTDYPNQEIVLFALSAKGYENLSLNMSEIIRYLKEQKDVIIYYRETFPDTDPAEADKKKEE